MTDMLTLDRHRTERWTPLRVIAGGVLALAVAMGIGRFAFTPILPAMQRSEGLSTGQASLLASANYAGYLVGALLLAVVPLNRSRRPLLIGSLVAIPLLTAAMATTTNLIVWGLTRFASGVASAAVFVLASTVVLHALTQRGPAARASWLYAGVGLGIALSGSVVRLTRDTVSWRGDWLALAALAALLIVPCWSWLPHPAAVDGQPQRAALHVRGVLHRGLAPLCAAYFLEGVGYIVTGTFLVAIVAATPGLERSGVNVWIVVGLAGIPAAVIWSALGARLGIGRALVLAYGLQAGGLVLPIAGGLGADYLAAVLFGGTFMGITALTMTLARSLAPERATAVIGLFTAVFGVGQILGPLLAAVLKQRTHSFTPALLVAASVVLLGGGLTAAYEARRVSAGVESRL